MHSKYLICLAATSAALGLSGCMTTNPGGNADRLAATYGCSGGTQLSVNYLDNGALVAVNGGRRVPFQSTPANAGQIYEGPSGQRLAVNGSSIMWNTAARIAAETCTPVPQPR